MVAAVNEIKVELVDRLGHLEDSSKLLEAQQLEQRAISDIEMMRTRALRRNRDFSRYLSGRNPGATADRRLVPSSRGFAIIDESHVAVPQLGAVPSGVTGRAETLVVLIPTAVR